MPNVMPAGRAVELPGRGRTWIIETPGPSGAPTVMLLHGLAVTGLLNWGPSMRPLGLRFRVVALDHRGHGRGIRVRRRFTLEDCADDAVALADALGIDRFIAAGYSMGGPIAQLAWHRHPDRVSGLVLAATFQSFGGAPEDPRRAMLAALEPAAMAMRLIPPRLRRGAVRAVLSSRTDDPPMRKFLLEEAQYSDPAAIMEAGRAIGSFSSSQWIQSVNVPSGVVITLRDQLVSPERQMRLARSIPRATIHPVDGDHGVCVMRPDLFVPALIDACESVRRRNLQKVGRTA